MSHPVVVVGHVGVGKTTFLHRSLAQFRDERSAFCALVDLEGYGNSGAAGAGEEARVAQLILEKLGNAATTVLRHHGASAGELEQATPSSPATLRTLLRRRIAEEKELGKGVWATDPAAWHKREYELFSELRDDPVGLLTKFVRHLRGRFRGYPVLIVLDNLDLATDAYQRCIYGFAQRLARETPAVAVVCIREDTFSMGREAGGFLSSSPLHFVFHVARPALDRLLRQRVQYGETAESSVLPRGLRAEAAAVAGVCELLRQTVLVQGSESLNVFAALAGPNMREALGLVRGLVEGSAATAASPSQTAAYAFECLLVSQGTGGLRSRCRIANCFDADPADPPLHGLQLRLLAYFAWAYDSVSGQPFLELTEAALGRFAAWGYPVASARGVLGALLEAGLLQATEGQVEHGPRMLPNRIRITSSGYVHLTRLAQLPAYRAAMACSMNWYDDELFQSFVSQASAAGGDRGVTVEDIAVSPAVGYFETYMDLALAKEDERLARALDRQAWAVEVRARSSPVLMITTPTPGLEPEPEPEPGGDDASPAPEEANEAQLLLFPQQQRANRPLPTIQRVRQYRGTVWVPRILWALEFARRQALGPQSPSDLARILTDHGQIDVPRNNVARAFRDLKDPDIAGLWRSARKRYEITEAGISLLKSILEEDAYACPPPGAGRG